MSDNTLREAPVYIGWASTSITPDKPVQLAGQFHERISQNVHDPVTATALAIETRDAEGHGDQAIIVSCDLVFTPEELHARLRTTLAPLLPEVDANKVFLSATHTHTAPVLPHSGLVYRRPPEGVETPEEYETFLVERLCEIITQAWESRRPGGVSWALGHAIVGHCRRVVYADGSARMYGTSDSETFLGVEGCEDSGIEMLFCWDEAGQLTGALLNVACPSQVVEGMYYVSADFWGAARATLRERFGRELFVLPWTGPSGDQSPRDLVRRVRGEPDMRDDAGRVELGRRIANALEGALPRARQDIRTQVPFVHTIEAVDLPMRKVTQAECDEAQAGFEAVTARQPIDEASGDYVLLHRHQSIVSRCRTQGENPTYTVELHALRLGDVALATNPFELYLDYGFRMRARSKASLTFLTQLACGWGAYLPTQRAIAGGHYGAMVADNKVGPEGGQMLVDRTVAAINRLWADESA
ncbi:MAG: hypothetical protein ACYC5M_00820 [Anaerolineae bacterium]